MRYHWQTCPNPDVMVLHVDLILPRARVEEWGLCPFDAERLDAEDREFAKSLVDIPGVLGVSLSKYSAQFVRSPMFAWPDIRSAALAAFAARFTPHAAPQEDRAVRAGL